MGKHKPTRKRYHSRRKSNQMMYQPVTHVGERFEAWKETKQWLETHPLRRVPLLFFEIILAFIVTGPKWLMMAARLLFFGVLLIPAWIQSASHYLTSPSIVRNLRYGRKARNYLDVHLPTHRSWYGDHANSGQPVLIFIPGGAWIIGYKAWAALTANIMSRAGIIFVTPDYRNFPQGNVEDMLEDVRTAVHWVFTNIHMYGGDPDRIFLGGQSAGAHLSALSIIQAIENPNIYPVTRIKGWIGVSGPYNMVGLRPYFHSRGLHREILDSIMSLDIEEEDANELMLCSPTLRLKDANFPGHVFPPAYLLHGSEDKSCPVQSSVDFFKALQAAGAPADLKIYHGKSHTDSILEDLMGGWHKEVGDLTSDLIDIVARPLPRLHSIASTTSSANDTSTRSHGNRSSSISASPYMHSPGLLHTVEVQPSPQLVHRWLIYVARWVNPF